MGELQNVVEEIRILNNRIERLNNSLRLAIKVYIAFWFVAWFAFVLFWVWRYTVGH